jgi:hypothetical protein
MIIPAPRADSTNLLVSPYLPLSLLDLGEGGVRLRVDLREVRRGLRISKL